MWKPNIPEYCLVEGCSEVGERSHLKTRAILGKQQHHNPEYYIWLCRRHHSEQHGLGIKTFCTKYGLTDHLKRVTESFDTNTIMNKLKNPTQNNSDDND